MHGKVCPSGMVRAEHIILGIGVFEQTSSLRDGGAIGCLFQLESSVPEE